MVLSQGRGSTAQASQFVDIPSSGDPHGFLPRQGSAASAAEHVDFPAGGGLHGLRPGQGSTAFSGPEHGHVAPRRSRRDGGTVGGPQGSVPGQSSTARGRARRRRFAGRLFIPPCAAGCGFIDSDAVAEFGDAAFGGLRVPVSWQGHFARDVLCPDGSGRLHGGLRHRGGRSGVTGLPSPHPFLGATTGSLVRCLRVA